MCLEYPDTEELYGKLVVSTEWPLVSVHSLTQHQLHNTPELYHRFCAQQPGVLVHKANTDVKKTGWGAGR